MCMLLQVVGLTTGYQAGLVVGTKGKLLHGMRLCQTSGVRLTLKGASSRVGQSSHCYMQVRGNGLARLVHVGVWHLQVSDR